MSTHRQSLLVTTTLFTENNKGLSSTMVTSSGLITALAVLRQSHKDLVRWYILVHPPAHWPFDHYNTKHFTFPDPNDARPYIVHIRQSAN